MKRSSIRAQRPTLRRGEPTREEKEAARVHCWGRARGYCEVCGKPTPLWVGHLHHEHGKRRFGWRESARQRHIWLCQSCHELRHHYGPSGVKPCASKPRSL